MKNPIYIEDLLLGLAIGDAFGAGVEFQDRNWIAKNVDFSVFVNARHLIQVPEEELSNFTENYFPWRYTDDTEMTIGVIKALSSQKEFSEELLINKWSEEYNYGIDKYGHGRNGHGSMAWYFSGEKTIEEIKSFQANRPNPGNAPAMRSVPLGLLNKEDIYRFCEINANATHPNIAAILSSQIVAIATHYILKLDGQLDDIIKFCLSEIPLDVEYEQYLKAIDNVPSFENCSNEELAVLCGPQPIVKPYFLSGINGVPSDSKYTAGCVLYILKHTKSPFDALKTSILIGGDVDSIASITTGILCGKYGTSSLPTYMLESLEDPEYIIEVSKEFKRFLNL